MVTLDHLKKALRKEADAVPSSPQLPLTDAQYGTGLDHFVQPSGSTTYQSFIVPQLAQVLARLLDSRTHLSVLEIGPGPKSVLEKLPNDLRQKIKRYDAFEPNRIFASTLEDSLCLNEEAVSPFPFLEQRPGIHRIPFGPEERFSADGNAKYDVVLFCHSMYGMQPKRAYVERALYMLVEEPEGGMVVVFHRDGTLDIEGLVCHHTATFPTAVVRVADEDKVLDSFAPFVAAFAVEAEGAKAIHSNWRTVCRNLGRCDAAYPDQLSFDAPDVMVTFTKQATSLPELLEWIPSTRGDLVVKNREARLQRPASVLRPTSIQQIQQCVRWAVGHGAQLTVLGGGHGGHCLRSNVVAIDTGRFDKIEFIKHRNDGTDLVIAGAGCKTDDIIREAMNKDLTVPLGSRPSVGAGLWLQGGIGHLARVYGLACDAIVGAVIVSVDSGQILCVGTVPAQHLPPTSIRPKNEVELLWAIKGAGTNFGVVVSVVFRAVAAPTYVVRNWRSSLPGALKAQQELARFDHVLASKFPRSCSADAYLYWEDSQLKLGVTTYETLSDTPTSRTATTAFVDQYWGETDDSIIANSSSIFGTEMYMSGMHGGHGGGKTSAFKRCVFLKSIGKVSTARLLVSAMQARPSSLCYLHLLQGGGAVRDVTSDVSAFGCRDWDFACVVTGVWPRDEDGTGIARSAVQWVYKVVEELLPLSCGVYGADLGPDPRDAPLAARAFGPNRLRLARLKRHMDPHNVLAFACPLMNQPLELKLIILVTGETGAGKDHCAGVWRDVFLQYTVPKVQIASISDATKREYATATGADTRRLLSDRAYKELHRPALTIFFKEQLQKRPQLLEEHFVDVIKDAGDAGDADVLFITGMREEAPVPNLSHLLPSSRVLEVYVQTSEGKRQNRRGFTDETQTASSDAASLTYRPNFIFDNESNGDALVRKFAEDHLTPYISDDLRHLADMVRSVPDFPKQGIDFQHVLGIAQKPGGLDLCTSLLRSHYTGDWAKVDAIVCCEVGGLVFASALASLVNVPLVLIRQAGKLPPPTISVPKSASHISSFASESMDEKCIEIERDLLPSGASVVVVDDVLSTGKTLYAVLQLLVEAGIRLEDVGVMNVAEFPIHRGRALLQQHGFGTVNIQSLLIFGNA